AGDFVGNSVRGGITDARNQPPGGAAPQVTIELTVPDGAGSVATLATTPSRTGIFTFSGVPIGRHRLRIVNTPTADTLERVITATPNSSVVVTNQFGVALW
ncbi:MAG TPA: hypothetical protein VLB27_10665, partial [candidate division Zixibacteria bacterium]|nr:hypothetical protein [candidate division Zixibacteria bacterium]